MHHGREGLLWAGVGGRMLWAGSSGREGGGEGAVQSQHAVPSVHLRKRRE
ncbi:hypothetical protein E2C01_075750 [Portunus trituberculatus]|uniref:Uncharacterized protein n=1 Tax=Portunus trituberculatus TaxID=210409 RepID=A0A5B7IHW3_PORTR|nr:hypothetical protein [Portunus trituberculatus]